MIDAMSQLISDCTFNKVDPTKCAMFDAEYIFLKIRAKSAGSKVDITLTCPDDKETKVQKTIDLDKINVAMFDDHTNEIELTKNIKVVFKYPLLNTFTKFTKDLQKNRKLVV